MNITEKVNEYNTLNDSIKNLTNELKEKKEKLQKVLSEFEKFMKDTDQEKLEFNNLKLSLKNIKKLSVKNK